MNSQESRYGKEGDPLFFFFGKGITGAGGRGEGGGNSQLGQHAKHENSTDVFFEQVSHHWDGVAEKPERGRVVEAVGKAYGHRLRADKDPMITAHACTESQ